MSRIPKFSFKNFSQMHYSDVRWYIFKLILGNRLKNEKRGGYSPSSLILLSNVFYTWPDKKITFLEKKFVVFSLWNEVSQTFMSLNIRHRSCVIYEYFFCVYWSEMLCAHLYISPINESRHALRVYEPLKSVQNCVVWNLDHAWDQFNNKIRIVYKNLMLM